LFDRVKKFLNNIKDLSKAVDIYKKDSVIQSLPSVAYVNKAKKFIDNNELEQAEILLLKALDISNQDSAAYKYLGKIYEYRGEFEKAVEYYKSSAVIGPQDKEVWLRLGLCRLNCGKVDEAISAFERANKVTPFNTDVQTGWGMALMKQKKYALARDKFMEASRINKYNFTAILLSAIMDGRLGDYEQAEIKLAFLAKTAPNESSTYEYANLKLLKREYSQAEEFAQKAIEINRQMFPAYLVLGEVYSRVGKFHEADEIFTQALENDLENEILYYEWGKAYLRQFKFEKACEKFKLSVEKCTEFADAKAGLALVYALAGDFDCLKELKAQANLKNNLYFQEAIGLEYVDCGNFEQAIDIFKQILKTDDRQTYNYLHIARVYNKIGNRDKTIEYYENFMNANPEYVEGYLEYAKYLVSISDYAGAQRKLRKAEKLDDKNLEILNLLFFVSYTLVKEKVCEYNIKEAISLAHRIQNIGRFEYEQENAELENILAKIQGNN